MENYIFKGCELSVEDYCDYCNLECQKCRQENCEEAKLRFIDEIFNAMFPNGIDYDAENL